MMLHKHRLLALSSTEIKLYENFHKIQVRFKEIWNKRNFLERKVISYRTYEFEYQEAQVVEVLVNPTIRVEYLHREDWQVCLFLSNNDFIYLSVVHQHPTIGLEESPEKTLHQSIIFHLQFTETVSQHCCTNVLHDTFKNKVVSIISFLTREFLTEVLVVVQPVLFLTLPGDETDYYLEGEENIVM